MPSHLLRQADFSAGELAPLARGHADSPAYQHGLRIALNFIPTLEGPLVNRPGTRFVCAVKDSSYAPRLISFSFTDGQNFMLEVGDFYIRFIQNGAQIQGTGAGGGFSFWTNVVTFAAGTTATFAGLLWVSLVNGNLNNQPPAVAGESTAFWGPAWLEVVTPWAIADVPRLDFGQNGDVIKVTHPGYPPQEIERISNTDWTLTPVDFTPLAFFGGSVSISIIQYSKTAAVFTTAACVSPDVWDATVTYSIGDLVIAPRAGTGDQTMYRSKTNGNINNNPDSDPDLTASPSANWLPITAGRGRTGAASPADFHYKVGMYFMGEVGGSPPAILQLVTSDFYLNPGGGSFGALVAAFDDSRVALKQQYVVTQIWQDTLGRRAETLPSAPSQLIGLYIDQTRTAMIGWGPVTGAPAGYVLLGHKIYRGDNGVFGLVGTATAAALSFIDTAPAPDFGSQPPRGTNPFDIATGANTKTQSWPGVFTYYEQRALYARSDKRPQDFWGSAVNLETNFDINLPTNDSDSFDWKVASEDLEEIRHLVSLRYLLALTGNGVFGAYGPSGAVTANQVNVRRYSKNGASYLKPLIIENGAVYQTKQNRIRDLLWDWRSDMYVGRDLSLIGRHLFDGGLAIVDMCYAETPFSVIYAPRSDGVLLTLTYSPGGSNGWARQTTQGSFERVASVEEADPDTGIIEDAVYTVAQRTVNGTQVRYIERFSSRLLPTRAAVDSEGNPTTIDDLRLGNFLDCSLEYDGRGDGVVTMHLIIPDGGFALGTHATCIVAGAGAPVFSPANVGTSTIVFDPDGTPVTARIVGFNAVASVKVEFDATLTPAQILAWSGSSTTNWALAVEVLTGLGNLEGLSVGVLADGGTDGPFVVTGGQITLSEPAVIVQVGLSYTSDMETLDIPAEAVRTNQKTVISVTLDVVASRGILVGQDFKPKSLVSPPQQLRTSDLTANTTQPGITALLETNIPSGFTTGGRCCVRQVDPLPLSIIAIIRDVKVDGR